MSLFSETMTKYHSRFKSRKNMLIHIPNYKLNEIKDETYNLSTSCLGQTRLVVQA